MFWGCLAWKRQNLPFLSLRFVQTASHKTVRSHRFSLPSCKSRALTGSVSQSIDGKYLCSCPHGPSLANQSIDPTGPVNSTADTKLGSISQSMTFSMPMSPRVRSSQSNNQAILISKSVSSSVLTLFRILDFFTCRGMSLGYGSMGWVKVWLGCEN